MTRARARRALARDLQGAAERGELELHYQLQTSLPRRPHLRRRSPDALAPSEARHDLAGGIHSARRGNRSHRSRWASGRFAPPAAMPPEGKIPGTVAVNLSPVQFCRDDLVEDASTPHLMDTGLSPGGSRSRSPKRR